MRTIKFYETIDGHIPIKLFLDSLPLKVFQKIAWVLKLLEELEFIPSQYFKKLANTKDIWECRISFKGNIYRILCFFHKNNIIVLTNGFQKKTPKTPTDEIELAEKYKNDYLMRCKHGT